MGSFHVTEDKSLFTTENQRTIKICDALDQLRFEEESTEPQKTLSTAQNYFGYGDEIHELPSIDSDVKKRCAAKATGRTLLVLAGFKDKTHLLFGRDEDGDTLLHISILGRRESITFDIIQKAPDFTFLNIINDLHQTALHLAVITRQERIVRRLMCAGAAVDAQDRLGNTPLHLACAHGYCEIVQELLKPVEYVETLSNNYKIPYQGIPLNVNMRNFDGFTSLHLAIVNNHVAVFRLVLEAETDINFGHGKDGRTALHLVSEIGNIEMLSLLLRKANVIVDATDFAGLTSFQLALGRGNEDVQRLLILSGATYKTLDFEEQSDDDLTVLREE